MDAKVKNALTSAVIRLLRPMVRIFLRNGLPYGAFAELARWVYVDVARQEFGIDGRKQTDSRVSILTGLSRKEVRRLRQMTHPTNSVSADQYNRAARVIGGWRRDPDFQTRQRRPASLAMDGDGPSFSKLVQRYSGDVPARAILDELLQVGAVSRTKAGRIRLTANAYLPVGDPVKMHSILGTDVSLLIDTIDHNTRKEAPPLRLQRKVAYDNVSTEALEKIRALCSREGQRLLVKLDKALSQQDRDVNPEIEGSGRNYVGVGIYYFEKDNPEETADTTTAKPEGAKHA